MKYNGLSLLQGGIAKPKPEPCEAKCCTVSEIPVINCVADLLKALDKGITKEQLTKALGLKQ